MSSGDTRFVPKTLRSPDLILPCVLTLVPLPRSRLISRPPLCPSRAIKHLFAFPQVSRPPLPKQRGARTRRWVGPKGALSCCSARFCRLNQSLPSAQAYYALPHTDGLFRPKSSSSQRSFLRFSLSSVPHTPAPSLTHTKIIKRSHPHTSTAVSHTSHLANPSTDI